MKKIILISLFFTSLFSDTIHYKENKSEKNKEIKEVIITGTDAYNIYYKHRNKSKEEYISLKKVVKITDEKGNERSLSFNTETGGQGYYAPKLDGYDYLRKAKLHNSGLYVKKSADDMMLARFSFFCGLVAVSNGLFDISILCNLAALYFDLSAIINLKKAGVKLQVEQMGDLDE